MTDTRILLRNGHVIDTEPEPVVHSNTDVLIESGRIAAVGPELPSEGATVIDATDRVVLPGFVDTHRHVWQSALRSAAVDIDLMGYLGVMGQLGSRLRAQDIHAATLVGALECLESGITTLMDFSHALHTPAHADAAVDGLQAAGLRAVFGYGFPLAEAGDHDDVRRIRTERLDDDDALVTMALAPLGPSYTPAEVVAGDWRLAAGLDLPVTFHVSAGPVATHPVSVLREQGLLGVKALYVHGNSLDDDELKLIADSGGAASVTPATEAMLSIGRPVAGRYRRAGVTTGLGADAVTSAPGDMFSLMRAALIVSQVNDAATERLSVKDVLRMATLDGAAALGLADRIGSLRPGKQADVILLRLDDLNLLGAERDPIAAVVTAAHPQNVDTVLVAGRVLKAAGRLVNGDLAQATQALRAAATAVSAA